MKTCETSGKVAHPTREAAIAHLRWIQRTRVSSADMTVYRCGRHWHVGHSAWKLRRRISAALRGAE